MVLPGACSPSRSVVSKMTTSRAMSAPLWPCENKTPRISEIRGVCLRVLLGSALQVDSGQRAAIAGSSNQQDQEQAQQQRKREDQLHGGDATRGARQCQVGRWSGLEEVPFVPGHVELPVTPYALEPARAAVQGGPLAAAGAHGVVGAPLRRQLAGPFGSGHHAPTPRRLRDDLHEVVRDDERLTIDVEDGFEGTETRHAVPGSPPQRAVDVHYEASPLHSSHAPNLASDSVAQRDAPHRTRGNTLSTSFCHQGSAWCPTIMSGIMSPDRMVAARSSRYRESVVSTSGHTAPRSGTNRPAAAPMPPSRIRCPVGLSYVAVRR